jgi:hypothetical protein
MKRALEDVYAEMKYNHLPWNKRIRMFLKRYRWRILFMGLFVYMFNIWGNAFGFVTARFERSYRKYKKRWITRYNPSCITYTTAIDTTWQPKRLARQSTERLSELFVKLDRELEHGMSRQLIVETLKQVSKTDVNMEDGGHHGQAGGVVPEPVWLLTVPEQVDVLVLAQGLPFVHRGDNLR